MGYAPKPTEVLHADRYEDPFAEINRKGIQAIRPTWPVLEVAKSGSKLWRLRYQYAGKSKRISLGRYPVAGVAEARRKRDGYLEQLRDGIDPAAKRRAQKQLWCKHFGALAEAILARRAWVAHLPIEGRPGGWSQARGVGAGAALQESRSRSDTRG